MSTTDDTLSPRGDHPTRVEVSAEVFEATSAGLRIAEVGVVIFFGLLVAPPLLILAVVVAVPFIAMSALVVRRVRAHHRAHGSTLFLHRLRP